MSAPLISVVIPSFNRDYCIADAIRQVQIQTHSNYEIVVVDDASTDQTREIVKQITYDDSRVRYLAHEQNRGVSAARNTGIAASRGEYIALLDSDDEWDNHKLRDQWRHLQKQPGAMENYLCFSYFRHKTKEGHIGHPYSFIEQVKQKDGVRFITPRHYSDDEMERAFIVGDIALGAGSTLFANRSAIEKNGPFREDIGYGEDCEYVYRHILNGGKMKVIPEPLMTYQLPASGKIYSGVDACYRHMFDTYLEPIAARWGAKTAKKFAGMLHLSYAQQKAIRGKWGEASREILAAAKVAPYYTGKTLCLSTGSRLFELLR